MRTRKAACDSIRLLGPTKWYSNLHEFRFREVVDRLERLKNKKRLRILELGVWPGYLAVCFSKIGHEVHGVDIAPGRLKFLDSFGIKIAKANLNETCPLPFAVASFDTVIASEILEHLEIDAVGRTIGEIKRILVPGGVVIISTPNKFALGNLLRKKNDFSNGHGFGHGHRCDFSKGNLKKLLDSSGLENVEIEHINFYTGVGKLKNNEYFYPIFKFYQFDNMLHNFLKILSLSIRNIGLFRDSIIVSARKKYE